MPASIFCMPKQQKLDGATHDYCEQVARTAFANPFGDEFAEAYSSIEKDCIARVDRLELAGAARLGVYSGAQRETMRVVLLFDAYQRCRLQLDAHIAEQAVNGDVPLQVVVAREVLALLRRREFGDEEARHSFALFFQVRRAYYFIAQGLVGTSACMRELRRRLWNNVFTHDIRWYERALWDRMEDFSTLLLGETGTGKGAAAAAIGSSGFIPFDERKLCFAESFTRSFVSLNLSQFPETLLESELFGHRKGAFTGAVEAHQGVLARCSPHGAMFLDEIGEVSGPVQIKLLRVLQERLFSPVGSHETVRFRGRVIAATNRPLSELRRGDCFRDDFYYRLCTDTITVPSLASRMQDDSTEIDTLLVSIVRRVAAEFADDLLPMIRKGLEPLIRRGYRWPGNVRELEQAVRRILLTQEYKGELPPGANEGVAQLAAAMDSGNLDAEELLCGYCSLLYERCGNLEEVARRTNLDRRTVKRYLTKRGG